MGMDKPKLIKSLLLVWPLLLGIMMIMAGNGLQGTLLGLRATAEGFSDITIGIVMSLYYAGFLAGGFIIPKMIGSVGHIRAFAGLASLASTVILLHGVYVDPVLWSLVRVISGFSFAGLFIVSESWLNNIAPNKLRAQILGTYIATIYIGLFGGQYLLFLAPVMEIDLFIFVSILISLSLLPVTLANKPAPTYETPGFISLGELYTLSPLAISGVLISGFASAGFLGLGPVYASSAGLSTGQVANFISAYILGSAFIPLLIGWISDRYDRRLIITAIAGAAFICGLTTAYLGNFYLLIMAFGGLVTSLYSVSIAYMNDQISEDKMVSATTALIFTNGIGACAGPLILGILLQHAADITFFLTMSGAFLLVLAIGIYRAITGERIDVEEQSEFVAVPARSSPAIMTIAEDE